MEIFTKNAQETNKIGREFASSLKGGEILALTGNLGSGKTTFVQGLGAGLGLKNIISPTFILIRKYPVSEISGIKNLYHVDLYRLERNLKKEIVNLGLDDIWKDKTNILVVEWADKIRDLLPKETIWINFEYSGDKKRKITFKK